MPTMPTGMPLGGPSAYPVMNAQMSEQIARGAEELGIPLDEHIGNVIQALQGSHEALGL